MEKFDTNWKNFTAANSDGFKEEHIFGSIFFCDPEDNYGQPQRLTTLYCFLLGTVAVDAVFSAGSAGAGEKTFATKMVTGESDARNKKYKCV